MKSINTGLEYNHRSRSNPNDGYVMPAITNIMDSVNALLVPSIKETLDLVGNERKLNEE